MIHFTTACAAFAFLLLALFWYQRWCRDPNQLSLCHVQAILATAVDGIILTDSSGSVEIFNQVAEQIFGYKASEIIGNNIKVLLAADKCLQEDFKLLHPCCTETKGREVVGKRKDGSTFPWEMAVSGLRVERQQKYTVIVRDVTERKRAEARIRSIVDTAVDAIIVINSAGNIMHFNAAAERMFGYSYQEVIDQNVKKLMPAPYRDQHDQYLSHYLNTGVKRVIGIGREVRGLHKNGTELAIELGVSEMRIGEERSFTGILRDISDRKKRIDLEKEIILTQAAMQDAKLASVAKSEFIATLSHELRTPLNGIMGMTGILLETPLSKDQQEFLNTIQISAGSLLAIINDILDFSKMEAGKVTILKAPFNLLTAAEDIVEMITQKAAEKHLELVLHYPPSAPTLFRGDEGRIRQILANIIGNSVKFTDKGHVFIDFQFHQDRGCVTIRVADTGIGIPVDKRTRLFQRFYQADSTAARKYGGTGLGLSISRLLAELMGGKLWLESSIVGEGSVFALTLPLEPTTEPPSISTDKSKNNTLRDTKVLVVEEKTLSSRALIEFLEFSGATVEESAGQCAVSKMVNSHAAGDPFKLVLVDSELSEFNPLTLPHIVNAHPTLSAQPPKLVLMHSNPSEISIFTQQFTGVLSKPIRWSVLQEKLLCFLRSKIDAVSAPSAVAAPAVAKKLNLKVLLAEDNAVNQMVVSLMLKKFGCTVAIASNGREAVDMYQHDIYDVILMDCEMPLMDGYSATRLIRDQEKTCTHLPVIALTANVMQGAKEKCMEAGMDEYMTKPITQQVLYSVLSKYSSTET